ncbi:MAG: ParB/Srx family N-terminal domain-containing protein [Actinomycetota bacterium]
MEMKPNDLYCSHPDALNRAKIEEMADEIRYNGDYLRDKWQSIKIFYFDRKYLILDGNHRAIAASKTGIKTVPCIECPNGNELWTTEELKEVSKTSRQILWIN